MKRHIPNLLTLFNLASGTTGIVLTLEGNWQPAVYLMLAAAFFDFFDGMAARFLKAYSETGRQLDSLADVVSFGVLPAVFAYTIFLHQFIGGESGTLQVPGSPGPEFGITGIEGGLRMVIHPFLQWIILGSILLIPVFSAIRLARFNTGQGDDPFFHGLPTPAHALFWTGLFWQFIHGGLLYGRPVSIFFLWSIMLIMVFQMILPVPMYTLKFEHFRLQGNLIRYLLIFLSVIILIMSGLSGLTLIILLYILLSLLNLLLGRKVSR
jgi:CDP-diacylglycerol---serine O-phosphatidyltransferase